MCRSRPVALLAGLPGSAAHRVEFCQARSPVSTGLANRAPVPGFRSLWCGGQRCYAVRGLPAETAAADCRSRRRRPHPRTPAHLQKHPLVACMRLPNRVGARMPDSGFPAALRWRLRRRKACSWIRAGTANACGAAGSTTCMRRCGVTCCMACEGAMHTVTRRLRVCSRRSRCDAWQRA